MLGALHSSANATSESYKGTENAGERQEQVLQCRLERKSQHSRAGMELEEQRGGGLRLGRFGVHCSKQPSLESKPESQNEFVHAQSGTRRQ